MFLGIFIYFMISVFLSYILTNKKGLPFSMWIQLIFFFPMAVLTLGTIFYFIFMG